MALPLRLPRFLGSRIVLPYAQASVSATATDYIYKLSYKFRVDAVKYVNHTGLAADATNYFVLTLQDGSNVIASWSTQTSAQGALTADTFVNFVMSGTDAYHVAAANDVLKLVLTLHGTQTLPAGLLQIEGHYV